MKKSFLLAAACVTAALAAAPLAAQTPSPQTGSPDPAATPAPAESRRSAGAVREGAPPVRTIGAPASARGDRISETAPGPLGRSGQARFRDDLATCGEREAGERADCRREMYAARAAGLYRD